MLHNWHCIASIYCWLRCCTIRWDRLLRMYLSRTQGNGNPCSCSIGSRLLRNRPDNQWRMFGMYNRSLFRTNPKDTGLYMCCCSSNIQLHLHSGMIGRRFMMYRWDRGQDMIHINWLCCCHSTHCRMFENRYSHLWRNRGLMKQSGIYHRHWPRQQCKKNIQLRRSGTVYSHQHSNQSDKHSDMSCWDSRGLQDNLLLNNFMQSPNMLCRLNCKADTNLALMRIYIDLLDMWFRIWLLLSLCSTGSMCHFCMRSRYSEFHLCRPNSLRGK